MGPATRSGGGSAPCDLFREIDGLRAESLSDVSVLDKGQPRTAGFMEQSTGEQDPTMIVAELDAKVVVLAAIRSWTSGLLQMLARRRLAVLDNLIVTAAWPRNGIGTALAQEAHGWARRSGIEGPWLNVSESDHSAFRCHGSLDYETIERRMQIEMG